jgi:hypothetical protein
LKKELKRALQRCGTFVNIELVAREPPAQLHLIDAECDPSDEAGILG